MLPKVAISGPLANDVLAKTIHLLVTDEHVEFEKYAKKSPRTMHQTCKLELAFKLCVAMPCKKEEMCNVATRHMPPG